MLSWKWKMNGHKKFCGRRSLFLCVRTCQYSQLLNKGDGKSVHTWSSTSSFFISVWCGFTAPFIILFVEEICPTAPIIFTVNDKRRDTVLWHNFNHVISTIQQPAYVDSKIIIQDGDRPHIVNPVKQRLNKHLGNNRIISR